jgi:hypothetical protein
MKKAAIRLCICIVSMLLLYSIPAFSLSPTGQTKQVKAGDTNQMLETGVKVAEGKNLLERTCKNMIDLEKKTKGAAIMTMELCKKLYENKYSKCKNKDEVLECFANLKNWNGRNGCKNKCKKK